MASGPPIPDLLAHSVPFGARGPAQVGGARSLQKGRADSDYWIDLPDALLAGTKNNRPQFASPQHILQIRPGTIGKG